MSFIEVIRDATGQGSLLAEIETRFSRSDVKRPLRPDHDYIRASSIPSLCPREEVLAAIHKVNRRDDIDAGLNLTFLHGTSLHWGVQNVLLAPMKVLYGTWRCEGCGFLHGQPDPLREGQRVEDWAIPRPNQCDVPLAGGSKRCASKEFTYVEHHFKDNTSRISGHSDGFLVLPSLAGMGILEIKSIGARYAKEIKSAPQVGHIIQAHAYMLFTGFKWAKILYWIKSESGMGSLVEHHIERDEETIRRISDMASSTWNGILSEGEFMPSRICANSFCPRAKGCQLATLCFKE
jgi:hypothetical protein